MQPCVIFYNIWRAISLANLNQGVCKEPGMTLVANFHLDDDGFFGVLCKRYQKSRHVHLIKHSMLMSRRYVYSTVALFWVFAPHQFSFRNSVWEPEQIDIYSFPNAELTAPGHHSNEVPIFVSQ